MTLREIFNQVLINSGCILLGERNIEMKINDFKRVVDECVSYMNKYDPDDRKVRIHVGRTFSYRFTGEEEGCGTPDRVPAWISDVIPTRVGVSDIRLMNWTSVLGQFNRESIKDEFVWSYQAPDLFLDRDGKFEVHACYHHYSVPILGEVCGPDGNKREDVVDIDYPTIHLGRDPFLMMVQGRFMQGVGRYRRAFTLNDLPITMDASTMVDEGSRLEETAKKTYQEDQSKFYLSFQ